MIRNVVTNMKDLIATSSSIINAAQTSIVWCAPSSVLNLFVGCGLVQEFQKVPRERRVNERRHQDLAFVSRPDASTC
jgi:hypothetical protein